MNSLTSEQIHHAKSMLAFKIGTLKANMKEIESRSESDNPILNKANETILAGMKEVIGRLEEHLEDINQL